MKSTSRTYQRKYLRAPFKDHVLYVSDDFVFKATAINISEGGMLLDQVGHFPEGGVMPFMVNLAQLPLFKNYNLERMQAYSLDNMSYKTIRFQAKLIRNLGVTTKVDGLFTSRIGLQIEEISPFDQAKVSSYIDNFSSNLIYLQVLIDSINSDKNNIEKIRLLSRILGYGKNFKISYLRKIVEHDYKSLQWL
jgi:hypothetical protein